jgi:hypothetical protein
MVPMAVIAALAAGGVIVPHAAGGLIVTSAAGYIAGTYLSTVAVAAIVASASVTSLVAIGAGVYFLAGPVGKAASAAIGATGYFGTRVGATGATRMLINAGIIKSTPVWVPIAVASSIGSTVLGGSYGVYWLYQWKKRMAETGHDEELLFTEKEAKLVEKVLRRLKNKKDDGTEGEIH